MNIEAIKKELVQDILSLEDENLLEEVKDFLKKFKIDKPTQPKLYPMSMDELNTRIDAAEEDLKYGRVTDIDDFLKEIE